MDPIEERNGDYGRKNRRSADQLEIEIDAARVRVWVEGASAFIADEKKMASLTTALEKILDNWFKARTKTALAAFGLTMLVSVIIGAALWLGWKGWAGPGMGK